MSIKQVLSSLNLSCIRGFLTPLYHGAGPGRKPYDPVSMLKAQLLKHLLRVPSDRRLALLLKRDRKVAKACGFRRKTPSHGLFTQFRHRLGRDGYEKVFSMLLKQLLKGEAVKGEVVALDSTAIKAYSQRSIDNKSGKSDREARVGRGRRGFKETLKTGLTLKEKPRKRQKPAQNSVFQIDSVLKQRRISRETPKTTATTRSTIISKQPSAPNMPARFR